MPRTLQVHSKAIPPSMLPVRLSGHEGLDTLFEYELLLKIEDGIDIDLDSFIGHEVQCTVARDHGEARQINALVTRAALWGEEGRHAQYRLTLQPWLHLATLHTDCRIFQNQNVVATLDELLADYPFPVDRRLAETYPVRDYQTQFNESDFDFFVRLCERRGINWHFAHAQGTHRLVLTDTIGAFEALPEAELEYHAPGWKTGCEYIHSFVPEHRLTSGRYVGNDYDYMRPRADLRIARHDPRPTAHADGEVHQWHDRTAGVHHAQPGAGTAATNDARQEGRMLAMLRLEALRTQGARARASGNLRNVVAGRTFRLVGHPRESANAHYLILHTQFVIEDVAQDSQPAEGAADRVQRWRIKVDFIVHPIDEPLRPVPSQRRTLAPGPQVAVVVGPPGQNLWTDALGRIKVQFPWDRLGRHDQHSTCWLRVSSPWAGNQLGGVHLPRTGQEVIVEFIGGNPDLPLCTGRVHNQLNLPPWSLPSQAALSGFRSRELTPDGGGNGAAGRSNHLLMDDTEGRIQAQLQSDHQCSALNLGFITRVENHAGRKDARGEGFELRTDGHGVIRAAQGLLVTTEARPGAAAHAKDMRETARRLSAAEAQHRAHADIAQAHKAQDANTDQDEVRKALQAQNESIRGHGEGFPELSAPHLVWASPAGIAATTPGPVHVHAGEHAAFTSLGHTSFSSARRWLASAAEGMRAFARKGGIRLVAGAGPVEVQAQSDAMTLLAQKDFVLRSIDGELHISAKKKVVINGGGSFTEWSASGIRHGTTGAWTAHAATHAHVGPQSLPLPVMSFDSARVPPARESFHFSI